MAASPPPRIFATEHLPARRRRAQARQSRTDSAHYLLDDVAEDVCERLGFLRHEPRQAVVLGDPSGRIAAALRRDRAGHVVDYAHPPFALDQPWPETGCALVVACFVFDTVDDLPGALIQARGALAPGGLLLATLLGAGSLPALRAIMLAADAARPAPRLHPQVDVRAGAQLLQRAGFADPVVDSRGLDVSFGSLAGLIGDLRDHGLTATLAQGGPPLGKAALRRAQAAFATASDEAGRLTEHFELLTLSGWRQRAPA